MRQLIQKYFLNLGFEDHDIYAMIENALAEISRSDISAEELVSLVLNVGECRGEGYGSS